MQLSLTLEEKQFLYRKFRKKQSHENSIKRVREINKRMHDLVLTLNKQRKSNKEIQNRFSMEFERLLYDE
jgi:hypothetical protein